MNNRLKFLRPKALCIGALLLLSTGSLFAQNASEIDRILETKEISFAQAAGFVLAAAELIPEDADTETALAAATAQSALPKRISPAKGGSPAEPIKLGALCVLLMKSFNVKGGFFYTLFPGPRYSYRELSYLQMLPEPSDPAMKVSGLELMEIVERMLHYAGSDEKAAEKTETAVPEEQQVLERELEREQMMASIQAKWTRCCLHSSWYPNRKFRVYL